MRHQVAHGHLVAPFGLRSSGPLGQIPFNRRIQTEREREVAFDKLFNQCCRHDYFGERCQIVHRINFRRGCIGRVAQPSEGVVGNLASVTDGDSGPGKRSIRNRTFDHGERRLQFRLKTRIHGLELHRNCCEFAAVAHFQVDSGNRDRQMATHRNFTEKSAGHRDLRDVADAKGREPRLCLREALNEIGTSEAKGDDRLAGFVDLLDERDLVRGHIDIALAIAYADE